MHYHHSNKCRQTSPTHSRLVVITQAMNIVCEKLFERIIKVARIPAHMGLPANAASCPSASPRTDLPHNTGMLTCSHNTHTVLHTHRVAHTHRAVLANAFPGIFHFAQLRKLTECCHRGTSSGFIVINHTKCSRRGLALENVLLDQFYVLFL